jgi:hypothetical protein
MTPASTSLPVLVISCISTCGTKQEEVQEQCQDSKSGPAQRRRPPGCALASCTTTGVLASWLGRVAASCVTMVQGNQGMDWSPALVAGSANKRQCWVTGGVKEVPQSGWDKGRMLRILVPPAATATATPSAHAHGYHVICIILCQALHTPCCKQNLGTGRFPIYTRRPQAHPHCLHAQSPLLTQQQVSTPRRSHEWLTGQGGLQEVNMGEKGPPTCRTRLCFQAVAPAACEPSLLWHNLAGAGNGPKSRDTGHQQQLTTALCQ